MKISQITNKLGQLMVYLLIIYNIVVKFLINSEILPHSANYVTDILLVLGIVAGLVDFFKKLKNKEISKELIIIVCSLFVLFLFSFASMVIGKSSILLFAWHVRNNYRVFLYLILCVLYFKKNDIEKIFNIGFILMIIHNVLCTYQLFHYYTIYKVFCMQDYVNGIFGSVIGYNTFSIVFMLSITCYFVFAYLCENRYKIKMLISLFICGWVTAISELKIVYVLLLLLLLMVIVISILRIKKTRIFLCCIAISLCTVFSLLSMQFFYPQFDNFFLDYGVLKNYLFDVSYGSEEREDIIIEEEETEENNTSIPGVNRFSTFKIIPNNFFEDKTDYIFGIGAGNAEYSKMDFLRSDFYDTYGAINYIRFSSSTLLLETGFVGLALYLSQFLVLILILSKDLLSYLLHKDKDIDAYILFSFFMSAVAAMMVIYDASLRSEAAYFYGLALSLGVISIISKNKKIS